MATPMARIVPAPSSPATRRWPDELASQFEKLTRLQASMITASTTNADNDADHGQCIGNEGV